MRFVCGEPALLTGKTLVIADIHLGAERDYRVSGFRMPSQTGKLAERILALARKTKTKKLVILGDVKHKVPGTSIQEEKEVPSFFRRLSETLDIDVVPGNHDGNLVKLLPHVKIHPPTGMRVGEAFVCHGHTWPSPDFLDTAFLVVSHNHPLIELKDRLGFRWMEKAWIRSEMKRKPLAEKYKLASKQPLPELVVMPAFSDLVGGFAMNRTDKEPLGPVLKLAKLGAARAFLLDGTFLGELRELRVKTS